MIELHFRITKMIFPAKLRQRNPINGPKPVIGRITSYNVCYTKLLRDDLAHSLKTRLALIHATMQEAKLSQSERERLNEQVVHMDQIVQYHLRRAVTGRQSLTRQGVDPVPLIQSLLATLGKVSYNFV